jgi:pectate lyase-like protein
LADDLAVASLLALAIASSCARPENAATTPARASVLDSSRIPDFSFAGYHMGDRPLPRVPLVVDARALGVKGDGVTDDTRALQAAIDAAYDGAVVLAAGRFVLRDALHMSRSGVVLRGAGQDATVLSIPESLADIHPAGDPLHGKLHGFIEARGTDEGAPIGKVAVASARGDRRLTLASAAEANRLHAGDVVRVRMDNSEGLLRLLLGGSLPLGPQTPKDYGHYVDWVTPVDEVRGDTLVLARALRVDARPEWGAEVLSSRPTLEEIGVEDLSFEFPGSPRRPHDYVGPTRQSWAEEGFRAIYFYGVTNAWVRNVTIVDADDAILLEASRFCQVEGVHLRAAHRKNLSGHHGLWAKEAQDCLFTDFGIETQFDDDLTVEAFANGNVFMRGSGESVSLDHHRNAPYDNLFTDLDVGDAARLWNSGGDANRGPHAGVRETLWNVRLHGEPPPLPGGLHYDKRVDAGWPLLNLVRVPGYAPTTERDEAWVLPAPDAPPNLYEAQRAARGRVTGR